MAYNIIFYEDKNGNSEIWNHLEQLRMKSTKSKERDDYISRKEHNL